MTILAANAWAVVAALLAASAALHFIAVALWNAPLLSWTLRPEHSLWVLVKEPRRSFISHFRSGMMLLTVVAILAVDFRVFPRSFAKTETFGTSVVRHSSVMSPLFLAV